MDKYIEMIDSIEGEIARLKASLTPVETAEVEFTEAEEQAANPGRALHPPLQGKGVGKEEPGPRQGQQEQRRYGVLALL